MVGELWLSRFDLEEEMLDVDPYAFAKEQGVHTSYEVETIVLDDDGNILGALFVSPSPDKFSFDLAVSPDYRRRGLGTRLVDYALDMGEEYRDTFPDMEFFVQVVSDKMERILLQKGFVVDYKAGDSTYMKKEYKLPESMTMKKNQTLSLVESVFEGPLFEEDEEETDDLFGGDEDEDLFADEGGEDEDLFAADEEPEEEEEEEEEEEPEPPTSEELVDQLGADAVGDAIADAVEVAIQAGVRANVMGESLATELRLIYEEEGQAANLPPIDIATYAKEIANLIRNYTTLLDVPGMIYSRSRDYVVKNFGEDWAQAFDEAMSIQNVQVGIGGDDRGPLTTRPLGNDDTVNPMTGPLSIGSSGEGGGGGGGL
jgi:GNAT superfamily N-acetyltransferase